MTATIRFMLEHLKNHPAEYVLLLVVVFGAGWQGSVIADAFLDGKIRHIVIAQTKPILDQVAELSHKVDEAAEEAKLARIERLETDILEIRKQQCTADTPLLKTVYGDQLSRKMAAYQALTGAQFPLLSCTEYQ